MSIQLANEVIKIKDLTNNIKAIRTANPSAPNARNTMLMAVKKSKIPKNLAIINY